MDILRTSIKISICIIVFMSLACKNEKQSLTNITKTLSNAHVKDLFKYVDASSSGVNFENSIRDTLEFNIFHYEYNYNGGGVAIGDVNNDGLPDIYFSGTFVPNRLYINLGNLKFKDVTEQTGVTGGAGIKTGVSFIDINNDGLLDIYVCRSGKVLDNVYRKNVLYVNKGNLKFEEQAEQYGIADPSYSTQAYWTDIEGDGDVDMFLVNHPIGWGKQDKLELAQDAKGNITVIKDTTRYLISDRLYINDGGRYKDKTKQYGVDNIAFGLSAVTADFNDDGYVDIYVCNDYTSPDHMYINQKGKYFKDESEKYFSNITSSSMGSDFADFNNDGSMDLFVNDMMPEDGRRMKENKNFIKNYDSHIMSKKFKYHDQFRYNAMQIKSGDKFENLAFYTGTNSTDWSWAALGEDFDQNGFNDLFVTNGYLKDVVNMDYAKYTLDSLKKNVSPKNFFGEWVKKVPEAKLTNYFFANNGNLKFDDVSQYWCDGRTSFSNGAAYGDLDNDGDLDIVVNNINDAGFIMENTIAQKIKRNYLSIKLNGGKNNLHGYGAIVLAKLDDGTLLTKVFNPYRGYMSSMDQRSLFASTKPIKSLTILWPDRTAEEFMLSTSGNITIEKGKGTSVYWKNPVVHKMKSEMMPWKHKENEYIDFKREPLLHMKQSVEGPTLVAADIDGDGMEELFAGGAAGQAASILKFNGNAWQELTSMDFIRDSLFEDVASCFADTDNDGDQDLIVASGGYQYERGIDLYKIRHYLNDGKGRFFKNTSFPDIRTNAASLCAFDADNDKDIDIFVGGNALPNAYPNSDKSFLLINEKGSFTDKTTSWIQDELGIVKDCEATDLNGDGLLDLILVGEWSHPHILINKKRNFKDESESMGFTKSHGLWQDVVTTDVDGDGDQDIVIGNLGKNSFFKASVEKPTCIYSSDFDGNGEHDAVLCTYFGDKLMPVHPLDELLLHMTSLRKKFLRYHLYSGADMNETFGKNKVSTAKIFNAYTFESSVFFNNGGKFSRQALPDVAQYSMIKDMKVLTNQHGTYLITAGNFWDTDLDFGKYDASHGAIFSIGKNGIKLVNDQLGANGNVRELELIKSGTMQKLIIGGNNEVLKTIELN